MASIIHGLCWQSLNLVLLRRSMRPVPTGRAQVLCKEHLDPRGVESETDLSAGLLKMKGT